MIKHPKRAAFAAVLVTCVTAACSDIPLLPEWDADWYIPLPSQAIALPVGAIPNGAPAANVSFPPQQQQLDDAIGALLGNDLDSVQVILEVSKTVDLTFNASMYVASSAADLTNAAATRIVVPIVMSTADRTRVDTTLISAAELGMLRSVADNDGTLHIQMRGTVQNNSGGIVTTTTADSVRVKLALLATVGVSQ